MDNCTEMKNEELTPQNIRELFEKQQAPLIDSKAADQIEMIAKGVLNGSSGGSNNEAMLPYYRWLEEHTDIIRVRYELTFNDSPFSIDIDDIDIDSDYFDRFSKCYNDGEHIEEPKDFDDDEFGRSWDQDEWLGKITVSVNDELLKKNRYFIEKKKDRMVKAAAEFFEKEAKEQELEYEKYSVTAHDNDYIILLLIDRPNDLVVREPKGFRFDCSCAMGNSVGYHFKYKGR